MFNRFGIATLLILLFCTISVAANDIDPDAYPDTVIKYLNIAMKDGSKIKAFVSYLVFDNNGLENNTCLQQNIDTDTEFFYKSAFKYEQTSLNIATKGDQQTRGLLGQYVFVNKQDKIKINPNDILECSGVLFHAWSNGGPSLSSFFELDKDIFEKMINETPYGVTSGKIGYDNFVIISYNKEYIDFSGVDVDKNIYDDVYLKTYNRIYDSYNNDDKSAKNQISTETEINKKVIEALKEMQSENIIFLLVQDKGDV